MHGSSAKCAEPASVIIRTCRRAPTDHELCRFLCAARLSTKSSSPDRSGSGVSTAGGFVGQLRYPMRLNDTTPRRSTVMSTLFRSSVFSSNGLSSRVLSSIGRSSSVSHPDAVRSSLGTV